MLPGWGAGDKPTGLFVSSMTLVSVAISSSIFTTYGKKHLPSGYVFHVYRCIAFFSSIILFLRFRYRERRHSFSIPQCPSRGGGGVLGLCSPAPLRNSMYLLVELKKEVGEGGSCHYVQISLGFRQHLGKCELSQFRDVMKLKSINRRPTSTNVIFPPLLHSIAGPWLTVSAALYTGRTHAEAVPLVGTWMGPFLPGDYAILYKYKLLRLFRTLKESLALLKIHYEDLSRAIKKGKGCPWAAFHTA